jgi:adhesin transport system membrane fusion protein
MPDQDSRIDTRESRLPDKDGSYVSDVQAAVLLQSPRGGRFILYLIVLLAGAAIGWSWYAEIDDVVKGQGTVIPSSRVQEIQNLEGGVLQEVLVKEGQVVQPGDTLIVLDDIQFGAELEKNALEAVGLQTAIERLSAEIEDRELQFSEELSQNYPEIVAKQQQLFQGRRDNLQNQIDVLTLAMREKEQQVEQLQNKLESAKERYDLAVEEQQQLEPLLASGAVSEMELLQSRQKVAEVRAEMTDATFAIPEVQSAILEAKERIDQAVTDFKEGAQQDLNEILPRYRGLLALQKSLQDKVARTGIKSPVYGTVKKIYTDTVGGTVRPGMTMMEIVPLDDTLLVETKIAPKDIGMIRPGLRAKVKVSAYDFAVYGGLDGTVEQISADSVTDDKGRTFFIIEVTIPQNYVGDRDDNHIIIPGMQAEVDVVVSRRRIIDYVLRPLLKAKYN